MSIPADAQESKKSLEILRIILASSSLELQQIDQIWAEILSLPPRQIIITAAMMNLSSSVIRMSESAKRTYDIIAIILRYGRDAEPNETCQLAEAVKEALNLLAMKIRRARIEVTINIPNELKVKISRVELGQIILNLLHNAIDAYGEDYSEVGSRLIHISHDTREDQYVHLLCRNQARPIAADARSKIFDRGFSTKGNSGSGLGLYISKKIAQRSLGDLALREDETETCFDLKLQKVG
jgi:signal transduction histidine kinase